MSAGSRFLWIGVGTGNRIGGHIGRLQSQIGLRRNGGATRIHDDVLSVGLLTNQVELRIKVDVRIDLRGILAISNKGSHGGCLINPIELAGGADTIEHPGARADVNSDNLFIRSHARNGSFDGHGTGIIREEGKERAVRIDGKNLERVGRATPTTGLLLSRLIGAV